MIFFIVVLRALAACLITNSHYTGIYPTDIIANGGLLGDVIFFAVSGYCLLNNNKSFPRWFGKRIWRIYPAVIIITVFYFYVLKHDLFVLRKQHIEGLEEVVWWYVYPTFYHFVASIMVLYIPFYFVSRFEALRKKIPLIMGAVGIIQLAVYLLFIDKSHYNVDNIDGHFIRFLFFESMLLGGYFRYNQDKFLNKYTLKLPIFTVGLTVVYFACKLAFSKLSWLAPVQIINQYVLLALVYLIFATFSSMDERLENLPGWIKKTAVYLSEITLEIYVVQQVIIDSLRGALKFPINWFVITAIILVAATALHLVCKLIYWCADKITGIFKNKLTKKEEQA